VGKFIWVKMRIFVEVERERLGLIEVGARGDS